MCESGEFVDTYCSLLHLFERANFRGLDLSSFISSRKSEAMKFLPAFHGCITVFNDASHLAPPPPPHECTAALGNDGPSDPDERIAALMEDPNVLGAAFGLGPASAGAWGAHVEGVVRSFLVGGGKAVAVGACGLDLPHSGSGDEEFRQQVVCLEAQARMAAEAGLPLVVSCVRGGDDAEEALVRVLWRATEGGRELVVVMHNYMASPELLMRLRRGEGGHGVKVYVGVCSAGYFPLV